MQQTNENILQQMNHIKNDLSKINNDISEIHKKNDIFVEKITDLDKEKNAHEKNLNNLNQAMEENIPEDFTSMFDFAKLILSKDFITLLFSSDMKQKGKEIIYQNNEYTIKIDSASGMFKEFIKTNSFDLKFNSYKTFNNISKIPSKATFIAEKNGFKCVCDLTKSSNVSLPDLQKFIGQTNDDSKSTGQD